MINWTEVTEDKRTYPPKGVMILAYSNAVGFETPHLDLDIIKEDDDIERRVFDMIFEGSGIFWALASDMNMPTPPDSVWHTA